MNKSPKLLKNRGTEKTGINSQGKASIVPDPVGGSPVARLWRLMRLTSWLLFQELREAEAVLVIIRELNSGWMPMRSSYRPVNGKTALQSKRTRPITLQRRYKAKERDQLLCNGVTKQKNATNYFATALQSKRTRPITLQRRYKEKERNQLLCNGDTKQKNASNYFATALESKRTRPITLQRR